MSLFEQLKIDRMDALRDGNSIKKDLLGCIIAESSKQDKEPSDDKVIGTIRKFIKNDTDTLDMVMDKDIVNKLKFEIDILENYLPKQLSEEEIGTIIRQLQHHVFTVDMKVIMKYFKDNFSGRYDGSKVSKMAKDLLEDY